MDSSARAELELVVACAVMYYENHLPQQAIARRLGVSHSTVSRLLRRARELGVVRIDVVPPNHDPALSTRLAEQLGLRAVHIAQGRAHESAPGPILAEPLTSALEQTRLGRGDVTLVSWGRAVHSVSRHLKQQDTGAVVAPAMGGYSSDEPWFQPNESVRLLALALKGHPRFLNAPAVLPAGLVGALKVEDHTRSVVALWDSAKVALVGVGAWPKPDRSYAAAGFPVDELSRAAAVGDVAGIPFTADGDLVPWPSDRELLGVGADQLRQIPHVIGLAGGVSKAAAAVAAARAGLISVLVTDAPTARAIGAMAGRASAPV